MVARLHHVGFRRAPKGIVPSIRYRARTRYARRLRARPRDDSHTSRRKTKRIRRSRMRCGELETSGDLRRAPDRLLHNHCKLHSSRTIWAPTPIRAHSTDRYSPYPINIMPLVPSCRLGLAWQLSKLATRFKAVCGSLTGHPRAKQSCAAIGDDPDEVGTEYNRCGHH